MVIFRLIREGEVEPARAMAADLADAAAMGFDRGAQRLRRRGLLRAVAAEALGVHPDAVVIARLAEGRVAITGPKPLYASVAGRGAWTALALSEWPVGVDVEALAAQGDLPLNLLHPLEREAILADPEPYRLFLRFWTAREAYLKAQGRGLDVALDQVRAARHYGQVALIEEGRPVAVAATIERDDAIAAIVELRPEA